MAVARQNIVFALAVKFIVLLLSIFGIATMWLAVFADVGVAVLAILKPPEPDVNSVWMKKSPYFSGRKHKFLCFLPAIFNF